MHSERSEVYFSMDSVLGVGLGIAVVLFYSCSDSESHKECGCINRLDDV